MKEKKDKCHTLGRCHCIVQVIDGCCGHKKIAPGSRPKVWQGPLVSRPSSVSQKEGCVC
jgi:hypothetical protein